MKCKDCGAELGTGSHECESGGNAETGISTGRLVTDSPETGSKRKSRVKASAFTVVASVLLLAALAFFAMAALKPAVSSTEANQSAVRYLKQSAAVAGALGKVTDVGWPYGESNNGLATLYMTVKGDKASGNYFATLKKTNGQWELVSGRVDLSDGKSIEIQ